MPVYFIRAGENGPVKIGVALNPKQRLIDLQGANYETLSIVRLVEGCSKVEKSLHDSFANLRVRGEWFCISPSVLAKLELTDLPIPSPIIPKTEPHSAEHRAAISRGLRASRIRQKEMDAEWAAARVGAGRFA